MLAGLENFDLDRRGEVVAAPDFGVDGGVAPDFLVSVDANDEEEECQQERF